MATTRPYYEMENEAEADLVRAKIARCSAELVDLNTHNTRMAEAGRERERQRSSDNEVLVQLRRMDERINQRMESMESMQQGMNQRMESIEQGIESMQQGMERTAQIEAARARNLTLRIAGQPVEPIPFLVGDRAVNLRVIQNDDDVAALNTADAFAYCQGYGLPTDGNVATKRKRIKRFLYMWEQRNQGSAPVWGP